MDRYHNVLPSSSYMTGYQKATRRQGFNDKAPSMNSQPGIAGLAVLQILLGCCGDACLAHMRHQ